MKKAVNKPLTDRTFRKAVAICLEHDPVNGLCNIEPYGMMPEWDVSQVTDMSYAFHGAKSFNQNISKWDVSSVTDMRFMFNRASIFNQDLSKWDVSNVTNMGFMFYKASSFNQDLSNWGLNSFVNMYYMFENTPAWTLPKPNFKPLNK